MATYMIATEVQLPEDFSQWQVKDLEQMLLDKGRKAMCETFAQILKDYEKALLKSRSDWDLKERWTKKLATSFGVVKFQRYRVWDRKAHKSCYPLDEALGIRKWRKETLRYRSLVVNQAVQRSYRQTNREIQNQTGVKRSAMSVWSLIQQEGLEKRIQQQRPLSWRKLLLPDPPQLGKEDPCPSLGIDLDETYCRSWKTKRWEKDLGVRVAVLYRHKVRVGKKRWLLKDKQVIASAPQEGLAHFLDRVTQHAVTHYGLHQATKVVVHGDGDPWIRNFALRYFASALYRLDPWHVRKKIREATGLKVFPDSWEKSIFGDPDRLILSLNGFKVQRTSPRSPERQKIEDLVGYLQNNREGLLPSGVSQSVKQRFPRLYLRGSGTIERNIAWTVNDRFKQPRMSWSKRGLENLLLLREGYLNNYQQPVYPPVPGRPLELLGINS